MNDSKKNILEKLFSIYSHHYDLDLDGIHGGGVFPATATYFLRDENYLISKKHVLNAVENYDYVYFCTVDHLDTSTLHRYINQSLQLGMARVRPHKEHMSSFVTLVIMAETIDPEAKTLLKRTKIRKYFRFAFHGWMEYHIAAVELSSNQVISNSAGRETRILLEQNFGLNPPKRGVRRK